MSAISSSTGSAAAQFLQAVRRTILTPLDDACTVAFSLTKTGGLIRSLIFIWGALLLWILLALVTHPMDANLLQGFAASIRQMLFSLTSPGWIYGLAVGLIKISIYSVLLLAGLITRMLSADILRHVLTYLVPFVAALWIAFHYLADIFELDREGIASHFIRQAAFASTYHRLNIENGRVAEKDLNSPVLMIGGPGIVNTHLENVAVFEKLDGEVHIIGQNPTRNKPSLAIDGFERLREVIDLRSQVTQANELAVEGRTRDGIRIIAQNVRIEFSVLRNSSLAALANTATPFSYDDEAIKSLVFKRSSKYAWQSVMKGLVRRSLQEFIAEHRLSEFLAASSFLETNTQDSAMNFVPRQEITDLFLDSRFNAATTRLGLQLNWIDVGTWVAPTRMTPALRGLTEAANQSPVTQRNLEAWKLTCENDTRRRNLTILESESRAEEMLRLVREVPLLAGRDGPTQHDFDPKQKLELIYAYLKLLRSAQADASQQPAGPSPELETAINFLNDYLKGTLDRTGQVHWAQSSPR